MTRRTPRQRDPPGALASDSPTESLLGLPGVVVTGYGVASGRNPDSPFPKGSIELQIPVFKSLGLDLDWVYPGTLNVSVAPKRLRIVRPWRFYADVEWTTNWHPEHFSFSPCVVDHQDVSYRGVIYYPHVETRTDHFQEPSVVEVLAGHIPGIEVGSKVVLWVDTTQVTVERV